MIIFLNCAAEKQSAEKQSAVARLEECTIKCPEVPRPEPNPGTTLYGCLSTRVMFAVLQREPKKEMPTLSKLGQKSKLATNIYS